MIQALNILYLGHDFGTSGHRADALRRLGHNVQLIDPWQFLPKAKISRIILSKLIYGVGPAILEPLILKKLKKVLKDSSYDVLWNNQCELTGSTAIVELKRHAMFLLTYVNDDPFGTRDKKRFSLFRPSIEYYDLIVVVRQSNVAEAYASGAAKVLRVFMSADEIAHRPTVITTEENIHYASDVAFIGTWMPERSPFLIQLMKLGVPLTIYGDGWQKAPEWSTLKTVWRGPNLVGDAYVKAIQTAKVCIGLLSEGNRDLHTIRSIEIPYIGSVLCAERTSEHVAMYREDHEAVFWNTPEECAAKCFSLLSDDAKQKTIAQAGRKRCLQNRHLNEPIMESILNNLFIQGSETLYSRIKSWSSLS